MRRWRGGRVGRGKEVLKPTRVRVMLLCMHGNVPQIHQHQCKLDASSGRRSCQRARKCPGSVRCFTGCRSRGSPHLLLALGALPGKAHQALASRLPVHHPLPPPSDTDAGSQAP